MSKIIRLEYELQCTVIIMNVHDKKQQTMLSRTLNNVNNRCHVLTSVNSER